MRWTSLMGELSKANMNNIKEEISKEIFICDAEIRKAREEIIRLTERKILFDDRKTMLRSLLDILDNEDKVNNNE